MAAADMMFAQLIVSAMGGVIGGFSGFVANGLQDRRNRLTISRRVAQAISGEIEALAQSISANDFFREIGAGAEAFVQSFPDYRYHLVRGEQDYMPVFHSLGINIGALPAPLPRDLVTWYTKLSLCIERSRVLGDLSQEAADCADARIMKVMQMQHAELTSLIGEAKDLKVRLSLVGRAGAA